MNAYRTTFLTIFPKQTVSEVFSQKSKYDMDKTFLQKKRCEVNSLGSQPFSVYSVCECDRVDDTERHSTWSKAKHYFKILMAGVLGGATDVIQELRRLSHEGRSFTVHSVSGFGTALAEIGKRKER